MMDNTTTAETVEWLIQRVEQTSAQSTGRRYREALRVFVKWCQKNDINPLEADWLVLDGYFRSLKDDGYAYSTVGIHQAALNTFYETAAKMADDGRIDVDIEENPTSKTDLYDVYPNKADRQSKKSQELDGTDSRHALSSEDVEKIVEHVPSPVVRNELLVRLCYQCMLRRKELISLKLGDVDRDEREVTVRADVAKNGQARTVYYMPTLDSLMSAWIDVDRAAVAYASESDYLFPTDQSEHLRGFSATRVVDRAAQSAGLQDVLYTDAKGQERRKIGAHTLRHSGAVRRWESGCDLETLRRLLGHEELTTTQQYLDVDPDDIAEKARRFW